LKPGGKLVYSVCTLTRAETVEVADTISQQFPDLEPLPLKNPLEPDETAEGSLWLWPQDVSGNGMFIRGWRKRA
jgi:16S rRNA (cytosine967-C5)-methyltransferase